MVKRQTVWLSTMMVLSLMLIGYYTMNNGTEPASLGGGDTTTTTVQPSSDSGANAGSGSKTSGSTQGQSGSTNTTGSSGTTPTSADSTDDWFVKYQSQQDQLMSQKQDQLNAIVTSNNATSDQINSAEQKIQALTNIEGNIESARDAVKGEGYADCVIVPTMNDSEALTKVTVYVKTASQLTTDKAVAVMNIVSQQLNIPVTNVVVMQHN